MEHILSSFSSTYRNLMGRIDKKIIVRVLAMTPAAILVFWLILIISYRFVNPPLTTLIAGHAMKGTRIKQTWVPLDKISRRLPEAIIMSEDARFCYHWGVDWNAVEQVWEDVEDGKKPRGVSTIPMQVAKNLFLWPGRNYLRKMIEVPLAYTMSLLWSKRRMIEIYVNIAEWGPGVFGAEAASRHHFRRSAKHLTAPQAARLAAALPNPFIRRAGRPGPKTRRAAAIILNRMRAAKKWTGCI